MGAAAGAALLACLSALGLAGAAAGATTRASAARASERSCANAEAPPDGHDSALVDAATLCLMNDIRIADGLSPLRRNGALATIATGQARDMVRGDYFGDQSLSGQSPLARIMASSYPLARSRVRLMTAQNIGWGTGPNATPSGIVAAWMQSPAHRAIILTAAYRDVGVGVAPSVPAQFGSGWSGATYAVEFGARRR
ncbi:MAG TPA: CAP domain-containing protein [Solirubrobacteraceae bacterium]|nr:CAP domain-containing protein [Solirubrobacteraceae bacterium]